MRRVGTVATEYAKLRSENAERPAKARHAIQWARDRVAAYSLYSRVDDIKPVYQTSFCNDQGATVYTMESRSGRLRVELAFIPDDSPLHDFGDDGRDDYAALRRYFRNDEKLGRNAAHLAALRSLKAREEAESDTRDVYAYGIVARVFYGDDEDPISEASCWGFADDGSQVSDDYQWTSAVDQYREAMHGVADKIRQQRRVAFNAMMREAFAANFTL